MSPKLCRYPLILPLSAFNHNQHNTQIQARFDPAEGTWETSVERWHCCFIPSLTIGAMGLDIELWLSTRASRMRTLCGLSLSRALARNPPQGVICFFLPSSLQWFWPWPTETILKFGSSLKPQWLGQFPAGTPNFLSGWIPNSQPLWFPWSVFHSAQASRGCPKPYFWHILFSPVNTESERKGFESIASYFIWPHKL